MSKFNTKTEAASLSVFSNTILIGLKLVVGFMTGSVSVISEAIHSGVDLAAAVIAYFAVRKSGKPADFEHPFGHGKYENLSGAIEALLIFVAAGWIIMEAVHKLQHPAAVETLGLGFAVMMFSAIANIFVSNVLFKVAKKTDSVALSADAWHLRTDTYTSFGVAAGLGIIVAGEFLFPGVNLAWVDPVAAIAVAILIIHTAWTLTLESVRDLLDARMDVEEEAWIRDCICAMQPEIRGFHHLRTRKSGGNRFIEMHLNVEGHMSVSESHDLNDRIAAAIKAQFPGSRVMIHIEPCNGECTPTCSEGCLLSEPLSK